MKTIGSNVTGVQGDIANSTDLDRLYEAVAIKGRIDVVFANAGVAEFAPLGKITEEHFDKLFDINVKGTLFTVQKALPLLNDGGSIILNGTHGGARRVRKSVVVFSFGSLRLRHGHRTVR